MSAFDPKQTFNSARFSFLSKTLSHLPKFSIVSGSRLQPTWCFFEYGREQADISWSAEPRRVSFLTPPSRKVLVLGIAQDAPEALERAA